MGLKMRAELKVEAVENGFIVRTYCDDVELTSYAFETAIGMAKMVGVWGQGVTKVCTDGVKAGHDAHCDAIDAAAERNSEK